MAETKWGPATGRSTLKKTTKKERVASCKFRHSVFQQVPSWAGK